MSIYQHFRPEERDFIDQVLNWKHYVETTYSPKLTDFLDPREQQIMKTIIGNQDIKYQFYGGVSNSERKRALIYPDYYECTYDDFQVCLFEIVYPKKFITLSHSQVLGSLMSLGLTRGKFGDILTDGDSFQFFVAKEVESYIRHQFDKIGKSKITLKPLLNNDAIQVKEMLIEQNITTSSMRVDTVISSIHNISRQKSQNYITHGYVKVNWSVIENTAFECSEGDIISVRGYGRAVITSLDGKTKKDKWRMTVSKIK